MTNENPQDPMDFLKNMWGNMGFALPGMVTPTVDTDELSKRIADLKAVEGWLKSNLSLLQMSIQALEMQKNTLQAFQQMSQVAQGEGKEPAANPFLNPAAWPLPWTMMGAAPTAETPSAATEEQASTATAKSASTSKKRKPEG